jgi:murein DD-endopeptidase MepM/ murein hydrolase activator NlpD
MSRLVELLGSRRAPQFAVLALVAVGFGGCSADTSTRFTDNSFSNPFSSRGGYPEATGSVQQGHYQSRELPQYARPASPPIVSAPLSAPAAQPMSGGGRGMASYSPPPSAHSTPSTYSAPIESTGSVAPRSVAAAPAGWSRDGGTKIIVGTADTLDIIAKRYNVPAAAILRANGYHGPRMLQPGQQLIIPRRTAQAQPPALSSAPPTKTAAALPAGVHVVRSGDTLNNIARRNNIPVAQLARANNLPVTARLGIGDKINVPGGGARVAAVAPAIPAQAPVAQAAPQAAPAKPVVTASAEPVQKVRMATETKEIEQAHAPVKSAEATNALPTFRWPVRGRIITAYGAKTSGKQNDGINVAVPEGTPVKAAEDGVVAYAGNELKGYGNLVLVRHSNGYVTAYAHASELMVKRGDTIKRGQVIAKSGQSGEVGSPQLHFEIRKGSSPVDPLQFLNGA